MSRRATALMFVCWRIVTKEGRERLDNNTFVWTTAARAATTTRQLPSTELLDCVQLSVRKLLTSSDRVDVVRQTARTRSSAMQYRRSNARLAARISAS